MKTFLLIDANALVHRSFHALPPFTTKDGRPSGALYGLSNILLKILRDNPPDYVAAFFDRPEPTFRKKLYAEYKIHRPKAPDELVSQIIEAHNLFEKFGVKTFEAPGFEADDLIGAAAKKFGDISDLKVIILTGDLDTLQLIKDEKVVIETLKKGISETIIYGETAVKQRFGILPEQIPDYKGLVGDPSDNIPGVKGVGPKTAAAIIQKYNNLENFFKSNDEKYQKILEHKDIALFSKQLATINTEAPLAITDISEIKNAGFNAGKIIDYFGELGFQSLVKRIGTQLTTDDQRLTTKKDKTGQQSIFENSDIPVSNQKEQPDKIINEMEIPLTPILKQMENWGIKTDPEKLKETKINLDGELKSLTEKIYKEAEQVFNINSPKQLLSILKEKFKLKITSTNYNKLTALKAKLTPPGGVNFINLILKYRELFKLKTTYIEPMIELSKKDGKIHPTFVQLKATTGRITCENPNLQNIPESIRNAFIAESGFKLASFDYSQIELRILASITGDKKMLEAFETNKDIHQITASQIFNTKPESITSQMRKVAKTLNFGISYGMGARLFAQESGVSLEEAKKFISEYFNDFPSIKKWQEQIILKARQDGFVENLNGRKRNLPEIVSFNQRIQAEAERMAVNFPIQSLAADIIKLAMIKTKKALEERGYWATKAKMLLTIHDELIFEIKNDSSLEEIVSLIKKIMESVYTLKIPLVVNSAVGENWGNL